MLQIKKIEWSVAPTDGDNGAKLTQKDPVLYLTVAAPIFWWLTANEQIMLSDMDTSNDFSFCTDSWEKDSAAIKNLQDLVQQSKTDWRKLLQVLPLGTMVTSVMGLYYTESVEMCKHYTTGLFEGSPAEREWADFCETLMDIRGIRNLVEV